jgi:hypothetical protein
MKLTPSTYGTGLMVQATPVGWLLVPVRNEHDREIVICRRIGRGNVERWAIYQAEGMNFPCLNVDGEWEYEPMPSNRSEEFLAQCRFESLEVAVAHLEQYIVANEGGAQ